MVALFDDGTSLLFVGAAARVNDVTQVRRPIPVVASLMGTPFAPYDADSGDVTLGASRTQGAATVRAA
jgi:hypothetical protein